MRKELAEQEIINTAVSQVDDFATIKIGRRERMIGCSSGGTGTAPVH